MKKTLKRLVAPATWASVLQRLMTWKFGFRLRTPIAKSALFLTAKPSRLAAVSYTHLDVYKRQMFLSLKVE